METNELDEYLNIEYDEAHIENSIEPSAIEKSLLEVIRKQAIELEEQRIKIFDLTSENKEDDDEENEEDDDDEENEVEHKCRCLTCTNYHSFTDN